MPETLESLLGQTFESWEGIVIDDGSSDSTTDIVAKQIRNDSRFKLISQQRQGVSAARNAGVAAAQYEWLLFLDADDWILPDHLQQMTQRLAEDPDLDAAVCGWAHVTPDGEFVFEQNGGLSGDLFAAHAQYCYSIIHTYVVRRSLVNSVGGFDVSLRTCEDWDLFQRIARTGARFGAVPHTLAAYRMRAGSATTDGLQLLEDGSRVLERGHAEDRRVTAAHPRHAGGLPPGELPAHVYGLACACAGYLIGGTGDAQTLLDKFPDQQQPDLDAHDAAQAIFIHAMAGAALPRSQWPQLWETRKSAVGEFLRHLESRSGSRGLAGKTLMYGDYLNARHAPGGAGPLSLFVGRTYRGLDYLAKESREKKRLVVRLWTVLKSIAPDVERGARVTKEFLTLRTGQRNTQEALDRHDRFESLFRAGPDPWGYSNDYEQLKYRQTLDLLPHEPIGNALELACAEGHFTELLAPRVRRLVAIDISESAIGRASERCEKLDNVEFQCFDFLRQPIQGSFDLIVCSEVLYYVEKRSTLKRFAEQLAKVINIDGHLVMAHSNAVCDEPESPGFDWGHNFGARTIGAVFSALDGFHLVAEGRSPLYRIQVFKRIEQSAEPATPDDTETVDLALSDPLPSQIASQVQWVSSRRLCVLKYAADLADPAENPTPGAILNLEEQLSYLHENHYRSVSLSDWSRTRGRDIAFAGRPLFLVLDGIPSGFLSNTLPLLRRYGFYATVLLAIDPKSNRVYGRSGGMHELSWKAIREIQSSDVGFAVQPAGQESLVSLPLIAAKQCIKESRVALESELAEPVSVFSYPGGAVNRRLQFLTGISGFDYALSGRHGFCTSKHSLLALPSITVSHADTLAEFTAKLHAPDSHNA